MLCTRYAALAAVLRANASPIPQFQPLCWHPFRSASAMHSSAPGASPRLQLFCSGCSLRKFGCRHLSGRLGQTSPIPGAYRCIGIVRVFNKRRLSPPAVCRGGLIAIALRGATTAITTVSELLERIPLRRLHFQVLRPITRLLMRL